MEMRQIGRIVSGCPVARLMVAVALVFGRRGSTGTRDHRLARLSTNSSHRVVPSTHIALVTDRTAAQTSIEAIRDVVHAVRSNAVLDKSL